VTQHTKIHFLFKKTQRKIEKDAYRGFVNNFCFSFSFQATEQITKGKL